MPASSGPLSPAEPHLWKQACSRFVASPGCWSVSELAWISTALSSKTDGLDLFRPSVVGLGENIWESTVHPTQIPVLSAEGTGLLEGGSEAAPGRSLSLARGSLGTYLRERQGLCCVPRRSAGMVHVLPLRQCAWTAGPLSFAANPSPSHPVGCPG